MPPARPYRPKVSRETRLLLTAAALAIAVLWLLARIRFQGLPATPNPIPAVFSQLASPPRYDDLAAQLAQIQARLGPSLVALDSADAMLRTVAVKLRDDLVVTVAPSGSTSWKGTTLLAHDPASGLVVASSMTAASTSSTLPWTPARLQLPRYFFATRLAPAGVSLYPVFVDSLTAVTTPLWPEQVWTAPAGSALVPGAWLFSTDAELVGLVIRHGSDAVIVPSGLLFAEAEQLLSTPPGSGGVLGVLVQSLTPPLASLTGAQAGVVVTAVDAGGPGDNQLRVGDVIETAGGQPVPTLEHWRVRIARLAAGEALALRIRRGGAMQDLTVVAVAPTDSADSPLLGLTLRALPRVGAEVMRVARGSAADRAALAAGDVITVIGDIPRPAPAQVQRAFNAISEGQRVMVAITRGDARFVTVLER